MASWGETFSLLFRAHRKPLEAALRKRAAPGESVPDLMMDVFARTYAAGPRPTPDDQVRALYTAARNAACDAYRHNRIVAASADTLADLQPDADHRDPEAHASARETLDAVGRTLAALSPRCRAIFILRRVHGQTSAMYGQTTPGDMIGMSLKKNRRIHPSVRHRWISATGGDTRQPSASATR